MNLTLRVFPEAEADLREQHHWYLDAAGEAVAEGFIAAFRLRSAELLRNPHMGCLRRFRPVKLRGLRSVILRHRFEQFVVFYRVTDATLDVVKVVHGARDQPKLSGDED